LGESRPVASPADSKPRTDRPCGTHVALPPIGQSVATTPCWKDCDEILVRAPDPVVRAWDLMLLESCSVCLSATPVPVGHSGWEPMEAELFTLCLPTARETTARSATHAEMNLSEATTQWPLLSSDETDGKGLVASAPINVPPDGPSAASLTLACSARYRGWPTWATRTRPCLVLWSRMSPCLMLQSRMGPCLVLWLILSSRLSVTLHRSTSVKVSSRAAQLRSCNGSPSRFSPLSCMLPPPHRHA
jgi:hypothetical protein